MVDNIETLFAARATTPDAPVGIKDLPELVRPLVEALHELQPHTVIAADRGARLATIAIRRSWKKRFPGDDFPTQGRGVRFARITNKSTTEGQGRTAVEHVLKAAQLEPTQFHAPSTPEAPFLAPKIVLLDDWVDSGGTFSKFVKDVENFGIDPTSIYFMTLCGRKVDGDRHIVGNPVRTTTNSIWNAYDEYAGVRYLAEVPTLPIPWQNDESTAIRHRLLAYTDQYYERFTAAFAAGEVKPCVHVENIV